MVIVQVFIAQKYAGRSKYPFGSFAQFFPPKVLLDLVDSSFQIVDEANWEETDSLNLYFLWLLCFYNAILCLVWKSKLNAPSTALLSIPP